MRALSVSTVSGRGSDSGFRPKATRPPTRRIHARCPRHPHGRLDLYKVVIIAGAILSWLIAFGVVNIRNDVVRSIWNLFIALTEPFLKPIRNFLPNTGGIDISPIILLLGDHVLQWIIQDYIVPLVF